ncbi:MAG: hypothetical protein EP345_17620 [Sphingomonadales bacterium]|nr:MAG: hypothetical protein EP345_17620 [Sphingomonadales bacterium]
MTRYSINFRQTAGTYGEVAPSVYDIGEVWPIVRNGQTFGWSISPFEGNYTSGDPRISGQSRYTSSSGYWRYNLPNGPGVYKVNISAGAPGLNEANGVLIRDGDGTLGSGITEGGGPGTTLLTIADGAVTPTGYVRDATNTIITVANWLLSNISASGTAQGGDASTITLQSDYDGDPVGQWINLTGGTGSGQSKLITAYDSGTKVATAASAWSVTPDATTTYDMCLGGGATVELTFTADHFFVYRPSNATLSINNVTIEPVIAPLSPLKLRKPVTIGSSLTEAPEQTKVFGQDPIGESLGYLDAVSGVQVYTIDGGGLAPYVALETRGGKYHIVVTSRIPDDATPTLLVSQITPDETKQTSFTLTMVPAGSRPLTGMYGRMTTETWLLKKLVEDKIALHHWYGYTGDGSDLTYLAPVSSLAELSTRINSITADGSNTTKYCIQLQNGDYVGSLILTGKDFGVGGLVLEPYPGHDPDFLSVIGGGDVRHLHIRNMLCTMKQSSSSIIQLRFQGRAKIAITGMRFGLLHDPAMTQEDLGSVLIAGQGPYFDDCETVHFADNDIYGFPTFLTVYGALTYVRSGNRFRRGTGDIAKVAQVKDVDSPYNANPENAMYMLWSDETDHELCPDYDGYSSSAHLDACQGASYGLNMSNWSASSGQNGITSGASNWEAGDKVYSQGNDRVYVCVAAPATSPTNGGVGGITGATIPAAFIADGDTSTGIVDGEVTWDFYKANQNAGNTPLYLWAERVFLHSAGYHSNNNSYQAFLNSNGGFGLQYVVGFFNCLFATSSAYGVANYQSTSIYNQVRNQTYVEQCSLVKPAKADNATVYNTGRVFAGGSQDVKVRRCLLEYEEAPSDYSTLDSYDNLAVSFTGGLGNANSPDQLLRGNTLFEIINGAARVGYPTIVDEGLGAGAAISAISKVLHVGDGGHGAKLTEVHEIAGPGGATISLTVGP